METTAETPKAKEKHVTGWGEIIEYSDSWAWGITPSGGTICLGREAAVREAITNPKLHCQNETINGIIELERKLQKDKEFANGNVKTISSRGIRANKSGGKRGRPADNFKYKPVDTRSFKVRKRFSGR